MLARRAIERADVVVIVIDATVGPTDQDGAIAGAAHDAGRGVHRRREQVGPDEGPGPGRREEVRREPARSAEVPRLRAHPAHLRPLTGERTPKLLEAVDKVATARPHRASRTGELNRFIEKITTAVAAVTAGKRNVRVMYAAQAGVAPPTFVLFTNSVTKLHFSYERFLQNRLREAYGLPRAPDPHHDHGAGRPRASRGSRSPRSAGTPRRRAVAESAPRVSRPNGRGAEPAVAIPRVEASMACTQARAVQGCGSLRREFNCNPYVLRSWEAEFPQIGQGRPVAGRASIGGRTSSWFSGSSSSSSTKASRSPERGAGSTKRAARRKTRWKWERCWAFACGIA